MATTISVVVFRGDPVDWAMYRHTALHVQYADGEDIILHVTGAHPFFEYTPMNNHPNDLDLTIVASILISTLPDWITKSMIQKACAATPVRNDPRHTDWNCQNWVGEALTRLVALGCVTETKRSDAVSQMVDACLEAEDEPTGL